MTSTVIQKKAILPAKLPTMIAKLYHSNQILKAFCVMSLLGTSLSLAVCLFLSNRPPLVIAFNPKGAILDRSELPKAEEEIKSAVKRYLELRYRWEPKNVADQMKKAESFISVAAMKAYQTAALSIVKFSVEKQVSQRVFADQIEVNLEKKQVQISGDRITGIQGIKAAGLLSLGLDFEPGPRTELNPWGLYITKEREESR